MTLTDTDPMVDLRNTVVWGTLLEKMQLAAVVAARNDGATWEQIGEALGVTHQAARQRWAKRVKALTNGAAH